MNDRLTTTSDKGGVAFVFDLDITCEKSEIMKILKVAKKLKAYEEIGTVEECRNAMERQNRKKPIILSEQSAESEGKLYVAKYFKCPTCGNTSTYFGGLPNNCHNCGQSLESDIS